MISLCVKCDSNLSSLHTRLCSRPSILNHVHYPSPLSTSIWYFPWPPPLCRWHSALLFPPTQLWLTHFLPLKKRNALQQISCQNTHLFTLHPHSARYLGFIFDKHLTFSDQIISVSEACYIQLCCIRPNLDSSTACTIATSIIYSKLVTLILCTINSVSLNYPVSSRSRILLVLLLKLLSLVISLLSYALSTGWESLHASNTSSSHLQSSYNHPTFITSSLFTVLALHPSLLSSFSAITLFIGSSDL